MNADLLKVMTVTQVLKWKCQVISGSCREVAEETEEKGGQAVKQKSVE